MIDTNYSDTKWNLVSRNPYTKVRTYVRFNENGEVVVRKTQEVDDILNVNHAMSAEWSGWHGKDDAIVARVPTAVFQDWKDSGKIDERGEDQDALNRLLNDGDYSKLRTGGGHL